MALTKDQKRKKKLQVKDQKKSNESQVWANLFNKQRKIAREKIREGYRQQGMAEEEIQRLVPEKEDRCF